MKSCRLDKRRQREEETNMENPQSWGMKVPATIEPSKPINNLDKKAMEESIIEVLSKKLEAVSLANFRRGGLKKIIEEEDARHVEAMHYAASAGI